MTGSNNSHFIPCLILLRPVVELAHWFYKAIHLQCAATCINVGFMHNKMMWQQNAAAFSASPACALHLKPYFASIALSLEVFSHMPMSARVEPFEDGGDGTKRMNMSGPHIMTFLLILALSVGAALSAVFISRVMISTHLQYSTFS